MLSVAAWGRSCVRRRGRFSGAYSTAGLKPGNPHWVNQDAFLISEYLLSNPAQHCFAVFDGHGELGHLVSRRCSKQLCTYFVDANLNAKLSFEAMQQATRRVQITQKQPSILINVGSERM